MDTVTQAALGALCGQAFFAPRLGRRAVGWGAVGGLLPDLDILASVVIGPLGEYLYHRGPTHAVWFGPLVGWLLGEWQWRRHRRRAGGRAGPDPGAPAARGAWIGLFVVAILTHPLLDVFTSYGTQLLWPWPARYALNGVPIIDVFYTGVMGCALAVGWVYRRRLRVGRLAAILALVITTAYLGLGVVLRQHVERGVREGPPVAAFDDVRAFPTVLQLALWRVVVRTEDAVFVGYRSLLADTPTRWTRVPRFAGPTPEAVTTTVLGSPVGATFRWFADDYWAVRVEREGARATVVLHDLRYGLPGRPDAGLWGLRVDPADRNPRPPERFRRPTPSFGTMARTLWAGIRGTGPAFAPAGR